MKSKDEMEIEALEKEVRALQEESDRVNGELRAKQKALWAKTIDRFKVEAAALVERARNGGPAPTEEEQQTLLRRTGFM